MGDLAWYVAETENVEETEKKAGFEISGREFKIISENGEYVFGTVQMPFMTMATIPSVPIWLKKSDIYEVDTKMVRW